jgi:4-diphosphocytidyl-2-C-methyl-D-erythritol kinase
LRAVGLALGADVPFFLGDASAALIGGIGERSEPLHRLPGGVAGLLLVPTASISTAEAFRAFDAGVRPARPSTDAVEAVADELRTGIDAATFARRAERLRDANDLWPAAASLAPELSGLRGRLERVLDRAVLLSGSGSTLFALYPSIADASEALAALRATEPQTVAAARLAAAVRLETVTVHVREEEDAR